MRYALAIFDLDGTLADSLPWFRSHMNDVADKFGFRRVAEEEIGPLRRADPREILERLHGGHRGESGCGARAPPHGNSRRPRRPRAALSDPRHR